MPKLKKGNWLPQEDAILRKVNRKNVSKIAELAKKWNRDYKNTYNHWLYLLAKEEGGEDDLVLTIDTSVLAPTKGDRTEVERYIRAFDRVVDTLLPNRGNVPVPNKVVVGLRRYVNTTYSDTKWVFSTEKKGGKPTGITRIFNRGKIK